MPDRHVYSGYLARALLDHYARVFSAFTGRLLLPGNGLESITGHANDLRQMATRQALLIMDTLDRDIAGAHQLAMATKSFDALQTKKSKWSAVMTIALRKVKAAVKSRLPTISNVNTNGIAETARSEAAGVGGNALLYKRWVTKADEKVRASHVAMHGMMERVGTPFIVGGYQMMQPGDTTYDPPLSEIINCFPAGTKVSAMPLGATRHWYEGPLVVIKTASGQELAGTPNHPVLTSKGWVGLSSLQEGCDVVCCAGIDVTSAPDPDVDHVEAAIDQVFDALAAAGNLQRIGRSDVNFHGDRPAQDVDIVATKGELRKAGNAALDQHVDQFIFSCANFRKATLFGNRLARHLYVGCARIAASFVGAFSQHLAFFVANIRHALNHGLAAGSTVQTCIRQRSIDEHSIPAYGACNSLDRIAIFKKANDLRKCVRPDFSFTDHSALAFGSSNASDLHLATDRSSAGARLASDLVGRSSGAVKFDPIVDIRSSVWFSGHVYNLETSQGYYIANGVVVHNCRCWLEYYQRSDDGTVPEEQGTYDQLNLTTPSLPARAQRRPGAPLGSNIPKNPTSTVTFTGKPTRARIILGNGEAATATVGNGSFTVRVGRKVIAETSLIRQADGTYRLPAGITVDAAYRLTGVDTLIRNSVNATNNLVRQKP
jgi:hypothetical protein